MAAVDLSLIPFRRGRKRMIDFGGVISPPFGGEDQLLLRLGNRFALSLELPPLPEEPHGRIATTLLALAKAQGALYPWPQPGFDVGTPGLPLVDGAVAGGSSLPIKGLTPYYPIRQGQALNVIAGGRHYLHMAASQAVADASGEATLAILPMLRVALADEDEIVLGKPMIEGLLTPGDLEWEMMTEPYTALDTFIIREAK